MHGPFQSRITSFVASLPWEKIERLASSYRQPSLICTVSREKYTWGVFSLVLELIFEDGVPWVIRLRMPPSAIRWLERMERFEEQVLVSEHATMQLVKERTSIPVPVLIAWSSTPDNPIGIPFVMQEAIVGYRPGQVGITFEGDPVNEKSRRYTEQIADFHLQLSKIRFSQLGSVQLDGKGGYRIGPVAQWQRGPYTSALAYYTFLAGRMVSFAAAGDRPTNAKERQDRFKRLFSAWLYRTAIVHVANSDDGRGPFPLAHNDLHMGNTIVDEDGNILAVLDWDHAHTVPLERFSSPSAEFGSLPYTPERGTNQRSKLFQEFLLELEPKYYPTPATASGRTLAELHRSTEGCIAAVIGAHLENSRCDFEWAHDLYKLVFGPEADVDKEWKRIVDAPLFRSWMEGLKKLKDTKT
ncbi:hypothetical protein DACRYDRAFT_21630 [Dacryopinax primogenitus]|uniref:Aminoglycoside phosphotransferase domain-containing protein n=1 Tax=Dacryopinax primogenitus (strain DJM 731) TaxID=1858805 RepID=M5G1F2_DACPD|nr:uncharacterized protein DACRYDRAFT_21630 [Dacryopinax primogenitus]EJU02559.1 hypothetical protein DACRYDRAFT_21630 [Dacryopinax primogenitus]